MRFALIATAAAAVVAVPVAVAASGPQMTRDQFLTAVRCAAYEDAAGADLVDAKWQLNAEARRQSAEVAALAKAEATSIARQAVNIAGPDEAAMLRLERAAACAGAQLAGRDSRTEA